MEGPNPLQKLRDQLVHDSEELQRFAQKNVELQQALDALEPGSPEAIEFEALLHERHMVARRWYEGLQGHWDRTIELAEGIWNHQIDQMRERLDADLAELWKSRPAE